ncbi:response regulator transcription factor [Bacillus pseudomycoides]|uniref:response regulator transcription factor n=1 Tax=Bacillus pseudomycoides TaxID=64104 RepID=UPI000BED99AB|nr:response regulator transcription factor [Bacillus pseudomycoides]PEE39688.1 DNA-binding response regulator [Bacillus pseudomycoides]PGA93966.1 DNA-binding response regulator [Bacillus pseudomycoides]PHF35403.1 DNA-binding response regulator [Bacillus pseudomycoides]
MRHIVYIEDDIEIGKEIKLGLEKQSYRVSWFISEKESYEAIKTADIIILDVMLPGLDGFTRGQRFKKDYPDIPIILVTALTALDDKLQGLVFVDDYLTKPFHFKELLARIEILLRRYNKLEDSVQTIQHLQISTKEFRIINTITDEEIDLSGKQHQIFFYLMRHLNQTLTKQQIFEDIWNDSYIEGDKTLMVHIRYLREKIEQNPSKPTIIETIRGIGYRLKG